MYSFSDQSGQATVEGAFLIPILLLVMMLLIQPGILLYDYVVMNSAAAEGCRVIATRSSTLPGGQEPYKNYILRRLSAVPSQKNFHVHEGSCSWEIELSGDETSANQKVIIKNKVKPLPLFDFGLGALGLLDDSGCFSLRVEKEASFAPAWVRSNELGINPKAWVEQWE